MTSEYGKAGVFCLGQPVGIWKGKSADIAKVTDHCCLQSGSCSDLCSGGCGSFQGSSVALRRRIGTDFADTHIADAYEGQAMRNIGFQIHFGSLYMSIRDWNAYRLKFLLEDG
jgi:hypothetical protein